jgi:hypothetical protein
MKSLTQNLVAVTFFVLITGCASSKAQQKYVYERMEGYIISQPSERVLPAVHGLMKEHGFKLTAVEDGTRLETDLKQDGDKALSYVVTVMPQDAQNCRVTFTLNERKGAQTNRTNDKALLWELVQRVDPNGATTVEAEANALASN